MQPASLKYNNIRQEITIRTLANMATSRSSHLPLATDVYPTVQASRVLAISDLHIDYKENLQLVRSWDSEEYR